MLYLEYILYNIEYNIKYNIEYNMVSIIQLVQSVNPVICQGVTVQLVHHWGPDYLGTYNIRVQYQA